MKHFAKSLLVSSSVLYCLFSPIYSVHAAPPVSNEVKVQVNEELVPFPDVKPYVDTSQALQIPIRAISQEIGYETHWEQADQASKITLKNSSNILTFTIGESRAILNGKPVPIDSPAQLVNGTTYIPFRDLAETLNIRIQWDASNRIAILNEDGKYHAPAWYAPKYTKVVEAKATAYTGSASENGGYAGKDYFGNPLAIGTISVDPSVIPLGSKVYIEGYNYDGLPSTGLFATASDIGSAIKGNKIDIFVSDDKQKAYQFGIQQVKIYILNN
jgi:3D (Asp-Asp-Asp) domain-containing protein